MRDFDSLAEAQAFAPTVLGNVWKRVDIVDITISGLPLGTEWDWTWKMVKS